jgi:AraC-like DNA-binding protein
MTGASAITTHHRETVSGSWWLHERRPRPLLAPYVSMYEDYGSTITAASRDRHFPFGGLPLIWTFEGRLDQLDLSTGLFSPSNNFMAGMHDAPANTETTGATRGVQVNLTPIGARMLLGMSMHELTNTFIPLDTCPGDDWLNLGERLEQAPSTESRFEQLDAFFLQRFARASAVPEGVAWAWNQIAASHGAVTISQLTDALGVSRKRIVSDFREYVGLPPKTLARVTRFSRTLRMLERRGGAPQWTRVAAECGFYDQAHLIREVRAFTGDTPTQLLRRLLSRPAISS